MGDPLFFSRFWQGWLRKPTSSSTGFHHTQKIQNDKKREGCTPAHPVPCIAHRARMQGACRAHAGRSSDSLGLWALPEYCPRTAAITPSSYCCKVTQLLEVCFITAGGRGDMHGAVAVMRSMSARLSWPSSPASTPRTWHAWQKRSRSCRREISA